MECSITDARDAWLQGLCHFAALAANSGSGYSSAAYSSSSDNINIAASYKLFITLANILNLVTSVVYN